MSLLQAITQFEQECIKVAYLKDTIVNFIRNLMGSFVSDEDIEHWKDTNQIFLSSVINKFNNFSWRNLYPTIGIKGVNPNKDEEVVIIEKDRNPITEKGWEAQHFGFLKGVGKIPSFNVIYYFKPHPVELYPKEFGHDNYISEAFQQMFQNEDVSDENSFDPPRKIKPEEIFLFTKDFIENNKSAISKLSKNIDTYPKLLGGGADGVAFAIGENKVLKLFRDEVSFVKAQQAMDRIFKNPELAKTEAMIYDVGRLGNFGTVPIYYYIMEKMTPAHERMYYEILEELVSEIIEELKENYWDQIEDFRNSNIDDPQKSRILKLKIRKISAEIATKLTNYSEAVHYVEQEGKSIGLRKNWLVVFVEEIIVKIISERGDIHIGNLGITNQGELRYFDPAHRNWTDNINYKAVWENKETAA